MSQRAFLRLLKRGIAYQLEAPTLWDVDFRTAVAQAELEDRDVPGAYHKVRFAKADGGAIDIDTTRPELLPACVALVAHPDDARYQPLFGTEVDHAALQGARARSRPHPLANPEKGTGVAMICTFGDVTDVTWWRELSLPVRAVLQTDGRLAAGHVGKRGLGVGRVRRRAGRLRSDRGTAGQQGAREDRRAAAGERRADRRRPADHSPGEVLRERRSAARDRHEPPVVHQDDRVPRGAAWRAAAS